MLYVNLKPKKKGWDVFIMSEFVDEIYKTIETMIQRYISKMKISQHYNGVVLGESGKHDHKYKVRIQGQVYVVKDGVGLMPAPNTSCWVCVPNNDWNLAFICAGRNAELGYVTQEALNSTRAALEVEIQDVYDECVSGGAVINPTNLGKVIKPGPNVTMTESEYYFTIGVPQVVKDVKLDGTSIVENGVADFDSSDFGKVKDVTVNGQSVVNAGGTAVVTIPPTPTIPVTDVTVDGTSVLDGTVAKLNTNDLNIINDVKVNGISVVNSQGVANVPVPSVPVTDVTVDGSSILDGTIAKLDSSEFGTTVVANPSSGTVVGNLTSILIDGSKYTIPTGGTGNIEDVCVNGTSVVDNNNIAQIDLTGYQLSLQSEIDKIYDFCVRMGRTPPSHDFSDVMITAIFAANGGQYIGVESTLNTNMRYFGHAEEVNE